MTVVKPIVNLILKIIIFLLKHLIYSKTKQKEFWFLEHQEVEKQPLLKHLIEIHHKEHKIIKTIESPRDLQLPPDIVQYSFTYGTHDEVRDILLVIET
jgi:ATPase